jgi:hypothetical protein
MPSLTLDSQRARVLRGRRGGTRNGLAVGRRTQALGGLALAATVATAALEWARVWRRGSAPLPRETDDLFSAGETATRETVQVIREGYRASPNRENAAFNMLAAFALTFGLARATTAVIRTGRASGVLRNVVIGERHIHHFVPGLVLGFAAGGIAITTRREDLDRWLALPLGAGAALVLDEAALLLELEDVYWTEEGVLSLQVSFATIAALASVALAVRLLRRGEPFVLAEDAGHR